MPTEKETLKAIKEELENTITAVSLIKDNPWKSKYDKTLESVNLEMKFMCWLQGVLDAKIKDED